MAGLLDPSAARKNRCRIEIGARTIEGVVPGAGHWLHHLYVIITDAAGKKYAIHGGPEGLQSEACKGYVLGCIRVRYPERKDGITKNTSDFPLELIAEGPGACLAVSCIERVASSIQAASIQYSLMGPNSNSVAYSLITSCGLGFKSPPGSVTPGDSRLIP